LRHKFGTKDTNNLLQDQIKVHDTLSNIQNKGIIKKVDRTHSCFLDDDKANYSPGQYNQDYIDLGNHLRHSVSHGYPLINSKSTTVADFNSGISKEYLADKQNSNSDHRIKQDWLGNFNI